MKTDAVKRGNIHKEPNVLTLQLKRYTRFLKVRKLHRL